MAVWSEREKKTPRGCGVNTHRGRLKNCNLSNSTRSTHVLHTYAFDATRWIDDLCSSSITMDPLSATTVFRAPPISFKSTEDGLQTTWWQSNCHKGHTMKKSQQDETQHMHTNQYYTQQTHQHLRTESFCRYQLRIISTKWSDSKNRRVLTKLVVVMTLKMQDSSENTVWLATKQATYNTTRNSNAQRKKEENKPPTVLLYQGASRPRPS